MRITWIIEKSRLLDPRRCHGFKKKKMITSWAAAMPSYRDYKIYEHSSLQEYLKNFLKKIVY